MLFLATICSSVAVAHAVPPDDASGEAEQRDLAAQAESLREQQRQIASQLLEEYPKEFDAWRIMGYVHSSQGNQDEMADCWRKCREIEPNRADVHDQLGRHAFQSEQYEEAVASWRRALEIDADLPEVHRRIGNALLKLGNAEDARGQLQQAVQADPRDAEARLLLAEAEFQLQEFESARDNYAKAAELEPRDPKAVYGLMKTSGRLGESDLMQQHAAKFQELQQAMTEADVKIRREFDDLKQMRQHLANTSLDAGRFYLQHDRSQRAETLLLRTSEIRPSDVVCRDLLAGLYLQRNDARRALEQFVELARYEPTNATARRQIGFMLARLGNLTEAQRAFESALRVDPQDSASYRALAKFLLNTKREAQRAHQLAAKAVELDPSAESYFVLGWSHAVVGNRDAAADALDRALKMDPNNANYLRLRQALNRPQ